MSLQPPTINFGEQLGHGAYGKVFKVEIKGTNYALKLFKRGFNPDKERKINEELSSKNNPIFCNYYKGGTIIINGSKRDYLLFELLDINLLKIVDTPRFNLEKIVLQLFQSLHYLNLYGIKHCDLKPENFVIDKNDDLKLIDFGISSSSKYKINTKQLIVSSWYRPPEIQTPPYQYDCSLDWWSAGCMVYEFLTGYPLFPVKGDNQVLLNKMHNIVLGCPSLTHEESLIKTKEYFDKKLPEDSIYKQIILGCIVRDPQKRLHPDLIIRLINDNMHKEIIVVSSAKRIKRSDEEYEEQEEFNIA